MNASNFLELYAVLLDITRLTTITRTRFWHASQSS